MQLHPFYTRILPVFAGLSLLLASCKENTVIRTDVVPAVDNITVFGTDTLTLLTKSVIDDTVVTSYYSSGYPVYVGAGAITNDVFFGKTQASFYFQVRPPQDNYKFDGDTYQVDSAILVLPYSGFSYGDTSSTAGMQTFKAYRMTEQIYADSVYYAQTAAKSIAATPFATTTVSLFQLFRSGYDSTSVGGVNRAPHIRLRIDDGLMNELIEKSGGADYTNTLAFLNYFNGIFVSAENMGNTIPYFRLTGDENFGTAGILLYYHTKNVGGAISDTLIASYPFDPAASQTKTAFFNRVTRDYAGSAAASLFSSTAQTDNTIMVQNLPGAAIDLRIPNVKNLPLCIVNKAELVITQISSPMDAVFALPTRLYPEVINVPEGRRSVADRRPNTSATPLLFIDGSLRLASLGGNIVNQYVLNFPRELQNAITEKREELRLRINGTQTFIGAYRLTAAGSNYSNPLYRIKLNVVYTKL